MSEGHIYSIVMANQTIVADATLAIVHTAAALTSRGSRIELLSARVGQSGTSTSQQLGIIIGSKASAFGTYTATTPASLEIGGTASAITGSTSNAAAGAGTDASAEGAGAVTPIVQDGFNNLAGWLWVPVPEERIILNNDQTAVLKLVGTPTTLTGWNAVLVFREMN